METKRLEANTLFKGGDLSSAAVKYEEALALYDDVAARAAETSLQLALDEYTKSAGNLCTCLHRLQRYEACIAAASRALQVNPFLAKCHAFIGMSLVDMVVPLSPSPVAAAAAEASKSDDVAAAGAPGDADGGSKSSGGVMVVTFADDADGGRHRRHQQERCATAERALMHLCRGMLLLPTIEEQIRGALRSALSIIAACTKPKGQNDDANATAAAPSSLLENIDVETKSAGVDCGNGVFARTTSIPRGTAVCSLLSPFSVAPYVEIGGRGLCVHCAAPIVGPEAQPSSVDWCIPCRVCDSISYCSSGCRDAHDVQHQLHECNFFVKLKEMSSRIRERELDVPDEFEDLAAHVITTRAALLMEAEGYKRFGNLAHHAVEVSQSLHPLGSLLQDLFPDDSIEKLLRIAGAVRCNALEVCDSTGLPLGQSLHLVGLTSFFNHSCVPNCAIDHHTQTVRTSRVINPNEQLSIAYIPQLYWPMALRRKGLAERYFFTCRCDRCNGAETDPMERVLTQALPNAKPNAKEYFHATVEALCSGIRSRLVDDLDKGCIKELLETRRDVLQHLVPTHYLLQDLRNTLTFVYSALSMPQEALQSSLDELLLWESIIPGALPVKKDKVRNALLCGKEQQKQQKQQQQPPTTTGTTGAPAAAAAAPPLLGALDDFCAAYGVTVNDKD